MTGFRFDHVGLLTSDVDYAAACYRALGCEVMERSRRRGAFDAAYLGAGTDVLVELQGRPLPAESEEYLARQGWSIERVALACDDAAAAHARLLEAGVKEAWAPQPFEIDGTTLAVAAGVWSPEGLMIDLVQLVDAAVPRHPHRADEHPRPRVDDLRPPARPLREPLGRRLAALAEGAGAPRRPARAAHADRRAAGLPVTGAMIGR